jgi:UDPglucose--hexose-1-phosphate uridylyltransferase
VPELRHDPLTGRLVLLAPSRRARPHTAPDDSPTAARDATAGARPANAECPFCPGHEHETPPEIMRTGDGAPGQPGWRVRVFPNLYPMVGGADARTGATGAHEVAVLSPDHDRDFGALSHDEAAEVLGVLRDRARAHRDQGRAHVQVLVNHGRAAGASIAHPHAQTVALDFVPPAVTVATERFESASDDLVLRDLDDAVERDQVTVRGGAVAAWCPSASAVPYEVRIAALDAGAGFQDATDGQVFGVAVVLRDVLAAAARVLHEPPYNVVVHSTDPGAGRFHWWVEVAPRTSVVAGFEMGTGVLVNTIDPTEAAASLRGER